MKIKVLTRREEDFTRERPTDLQKVHRTQDPKAHPFERPREYVRALNETKLSRAFAKPFVAAFDGHRDGVYTMTKHPGKLSCFASGSADGEIRLWNLATRVCVGRVDRAHRGFVRGLVVNTLGQIISCGDDKTVKLWHVESPNWEETSTALHGDDDEDENDEGYSDVDVSLGDDDEDENMGDDTQAKIRRRNQREKSQERKNRRFAVPIYTSPIASSNQTFAEQVTANASTKPMQLWLGKAPFTAVSHQYPYKPTSVFATTCTDSTVDVWSYERSEPISTLRWSSTSGDDSLTSCAFNPTEHDLIAATSQSDRSVLFFDLRSNTPVRKLVLAMNSNVLAWNPMETFNFTVGNEDHNCYTFDMRKLQTALNVHIDHVGAVLDVEYSPTGREFVTGSYDRTVRIFPVDKGRSREVYHTKRMQRVFCVKFTADAKYVLSGSDDANIRLWKADASSPLGILVPRQREKAEYGQKLIQRYKHLPEVRRIDTKRHVPKIIYQTQKLKRIMKASAKRKLENKRAHSRPGSVTFEAERRKQIVKETE